MWRYYSTKFSERVTAEYDQRGGSAPSDRLSMRNAIAREQFDALPAEERRSLENEAMQLYNEEVDNWDKAEKGELDEPDAEEQAE